MRTALLTVLWLALSGWIGGWLLFGAVVAPTAFGSLPTEMAGLVVGPALDWLHWYGALAGVVLAVTARLLGRGWLPVALALGSGALCLVSQLAVTPAIAAVRDGTFGPDGSLLAAERFNQLHRLSMTLFMTAGAGALALLGIHARADARGQLGRGDGPSERP